MISGRTIDTNRFSATVKKLKAHFSQRVVNQNKAADALLEAVELRLSELHDATKPAGVFLFLGPTGSGKTHIVEMLAEAIFGSPNAMTKIDCAEFQHSHEIAKLIGSPPGYLGHNETPALLTQDNINRFSNIEIPVNIILFDEIEKASDAVWHLMLGILDKATCTLGTNKTTSFSNSIIVLTSNLGANEMADAIDGGIGFAPGADQSESKLHDIANGAAKRKFTPEFLNRLDEVIVFNTLTEDDIKQILDLELSQFTTMLFRQQSSFIRVSPAAKKELLRVGYDKKYNARFMKRAIKKYVVRPIARAFQAKEISPGEDVIIDFKKSFSYHVRSGDKGTTASVLSS